MKQVPFTRRRWTRDEYDRLVETGVFEGEPLELIGGELMVAEPKYPYHTTGVTLVDYVIRAALPPGWLGGTQAAVSLDDESEPEPDVAVVQGLIIPNPPMFQCPGNSYTYDPSNGMINMTVTDHSAC